MEKFILVMVTAPDDSEAGKIAEALVREGLAACVTRHGTRSVYRWKGQVEKQDEVLLLVKTAERHLEAIMGRVRELHSYDVPEIIALPIIGGNPEYLSWITESMN